MNNLKNQNKVKKRVTWEMDKVKVNKKYKKEFVIEDVERKEDRQKKTCCPIFYYYIFSIFY